MFLLRYLTRRGLVMIAVTALLCSVSTTTMAQTPARSPSDTVREFYKAMREKRFRDAFALSIYKPAVEGLKPEEYEDLRPDFERVAGVVPEKIEITGEQISGKEASVFMKVPRDDDPTQFDITTTPLMIVAGAWIIGDKDSQALVKKAGNAFFPETRITAHHGDVQSMLKLIYGAQLIYSQQHNGLFGDLATLIGLGMLPKDLEGTESTGYRFRISLGKDAKTYTVGAEPAQYGRTGRLSFFMDQSGVRNGDNGGKPLNVKAQSN